MAKNISVMNDLHRISDKIAESAQHIHEPGQQMPPGSAMPDADNATQVITIPQAPSELLQRRYRDFSRGRRDLLERLASMTSRLEAESVSAEARLTVVRETLEQLKKLTADLPEDDLEKISFTDRSELAKACLELERLRLEAIKLAPAVENVHRPDGVSAAPVSTERNSILLDSLSFRQVFRLAFFASLPVLIGLVISAIILTVGIVGAFKGWF